MKVTNEMIAAAWKTWHSRHGGKLGPGPAFVEAIQVALDESYDNIDYIIDSRGQVHHNFTIIYKEKK